MQQAQADLDVTSRNLAAQFPETHATVTVRIVPLLDSVVGDYASTLWLLGAAVALLLLIACANVASLHLARSLERRKEMTIRASLGASRGRLVRQLMFENTALLSLGGATGFVFAHWAIGAMRFDEVGFDSGAFIVVLAITLLISFLAGLFPAMALAQADLSSALRGEGTFGGTGGPQRQRTQSALVICQAALASLLLFGCDLLARSFQAFPRPRSDRKTNSRLRRNRRVHSNQLYNCRGGAEHLSGESGSAANPFSKLFSVRSTTSLRSTPRRFLHVGSPHRWRSCFAHAHYSKGCGISRSRRTDF